MSLEFGCELGVGEVVISITYVGCLNDQMRGFYRFKYTIDGEERYGAATQFEVYSNLCILTINVVLPPCVLLFCRLPKLVEPYLVGMSQLTKPPMMSLLLFPKIELLSPIW